MSKQLSPAIGSPSVTFRDPKITLMKSGYFQEYLRRHLRDKA